MKPKIHPKNNFVVFVDLASGSEFYTTSTLHSEETKKHNGIDYQVIKIETSSASHPFYTGTQKTATKGNQVTKYLERVKKAQAANEPKPTVATADEPTKSKAKKSTAKATKKK